MSRFATAPDASGPQITIRATTRQQPSSPEGDELRGKERANYLREITISHANDLAPRLNHEVALAEEEAIVRRTGGVRVTRHEYSRYTVEVTGEVPFGLTLERDLAF